MEQPVTESYIDAYIEGLGLVRFDEARDVWFAKSSHAQMVREHCDRDGGPVDSAAVIAAARHLGAPWQTTEQVRASALIVVDVMLSDIENIRQSGGLKKVNADYKAYRQRQIEQRQRAITYTEFFRNFATTLIRIAAEQRRMT